RLKTMELKTDCHTKYTISSLVVYLFFNSNDLRQDSKFLSIYDYSMGCCEDKDGKLASYNMVNEFESRIFAKKVKMGGVGYVASYPENRGQGDINRLMNEIILEL